MEVILLQIWLKSPPSDARAQDPNQHEHADLLNIKSSDSYLIEKEKTKLDFAGAHLTKQREEDGKDAWNWTA
eukprot:561024-Pelagomonas_calceolata.AAC.1